MISKILLFLGGFIAGGIIRDIDFSHWFKVNSDKWFYFYFVNLYILLPISILLTFFGTYLSHSFIPSLFILIGSCIISYSALGFQYAAFDLGRGVKTIWLAPSVEIKIFYWFLIHLALLFFGGLLILCSNLSW